MRYAMYVQILTLIVLLYYCTMDMYEYYELKRIVRKRKITESECMSCFYPPVKPELQTNSEIPRAYETKEYATCLGCG